MVNVTVTLNLQGTLGLALVLDLALVLVLVLVLVLGTRDPPVIAVDVAQVDGRSGWPWSLCRALVTAESTEQVVRG